MSCLQALSRVFLVVVNIVFLLIGLAFFAAGLFVRFGTAVLNSYIDGVKKSLEDSAGDTGVGTINLDDFNISELLTGVALGLIFFGLFLIIITILGCCGACCKVKWMLIGYVIICGVLLVAQIVVIGILYGSPDTFHDPAKKTMKEKIQSDYQGLTGFDVVSMAWNIIMQQVKCCGVDSYNDFTGAGKWNITAFTGYTLQTPVACCMTLPSSSDVSCAVVGTAGPSNNYWEEGCYDKIWGMSLGQANMMIGILVGIGVFQLAVLAMGIITLVMDRKNKVGN